MSFLQDCGPVGFQPALNPRHRGDPVISCAAASSFIRGFNYFSFLVLAPPNPPLSPLLGGDPGKACLPLLRSEQPRKRGEHRGGGDTDAKTSPPPTPRSSKAAAPLEERQAQLEQRQGQMRGCHEDDFLCLLNGSPEQPLPPWRGSSSEHLRGLESLVLREGRDVPEQWPWEGLFQELGALCWEGR